MRRIHRSPANSLHKGQWCGALMFSLICTRINVWVNTGEAGDLRRHRASYGCLLWGLYLLIRPLKYCKYLYWAQKSLSVGQDCPLLAFLTSTLELPILCAVGINIKVLEFPENSHDMVTCAHKSTCTHILIVFVSVMIKCINSHV